MQVDFQHVFQTLVKRRLWIMIPMLVFTSLAVVYSLFKQDYWMSSQALYIRDESIGQLTPLGRFESVDSMQTAQETIYEVSQHPIVLRQAMLDVGPYKKPWSKKARKDWPSARAVDDFRGSVSIDAPNGAQFGRTELIYLSVKAEKPERANQLTDAMARRLIQQMKSLRKQKYEGIVDELNRSATIAQSELEEAIAKLESLDRTMGSDVVEMRVMNNDSMGEGTLRRTLGELRTELRAASGEYSRNKMEREQLNALKSDPKKLMSMPSAMFANHPTLQGLQRGLADATMNAARMSSEMSPDHPNVLAATATVRKVRQQLYRELQNAAASANGELAISKSKVVAIAKQLKSYESRFSKLSEMRTTYSRLSKEVEQRQEFIEKVETDLAIARSNTAAAMASSTIQRIDNPICSINPIGPGGKSICLAGLFGGLFTGLGLIWLTEPVNNSPSTDPGTTNTPAENKATPKETAVGGRRQSDRFGRRAEDWIDSVWPGGKPKGDGAQTVPSQERGNTRKGSPARKASPGKVMLSDKAKLKPTPKTDSIAEPKAKTATKTSSKPKTTVPNPAQLEAAKAKLIREIKEELKSRKK